MEINRIVNVGTAPQPAAAAATPAETAKSFAKFLTDALDEVNKAQTESADLVKKFAAGQVEDVHQVMIASQKSTILLQMTMQVRNKAIESYQEIMRMSI